MSVRFEKLIALGWYPTECPVCGLSCGAVAHPATTAQLDKARDEENEACAKICEVLLTGGIGAYAASIRARRMK